VVSRLVPAERFLPKGSYRNVPAKKDPAKKAPETQRFLPKGSCQKGSYQKGSWKCRSWAIRFLPKGSCQQDSQVHMVPAKNIPRSIWFLSKIFPGLYGSCTKYSQVHMVPRFNFLIFNSKFLKLYNNININQSFSCHYLHKNSPCSFKTRFSRNTPLLM
jgi:hypothetical protein